MSYLALVTNNFDEVSHFYETSLGFPIVEQWDREHGRGHRFDIGGMRLEILDNARERHPLWVFYPSERFQIVVEVSDIEAAHERIAVSAPKPEATSWGATLFQVRDPDGVPVTFLQWNEGGAV
jgi:catechol 2,3-dioxygenase-like lactoylglutathione lyase family enzyme